INALSITKNDALWLLVVGRDRDEPRFRAQARAAGLEARVRFLGPKEDVRPLYAAADCFMLPSRYDPFPNTVLEALAMGLPAIVSSRCGAAEVVEPGVNGWVCEPDDVAGIARLLQEADRTVHDGRMGIAARSTAERYGLDAMAAQLSRLYESLK
ncbi:MAG TPA: glycosyltransferase family 4 protein, partial [Burkholderiales bacterium]|nr:glycosyltransferase family 4 protein [Burkholderiales bacterium]